MVIFALLSTIVLIFIDHYTKNLAVANLKGNPSHVLIDGIFQLTYVENRGAAFGLLKDQTVFFVVFTIIALTGLLYYFLKLPKTKANIFSRVGLVLIISGAIGNFIDRVTLRYVVDFLDPIFIKFMNFPVFNFADVYVVVGSVMLAIMVTFFEKEVNISKDNEK